MYIMPITGKNLAGYGLSGVHVYYAEKWKESGRLWISDAHYANSWQNLAGYGLSDVYYADNWKESSRLWTV